MKPNITTLSMDLVAEDGTLLRLAVHRTDAGHIELDNLLEVAECRTGEDFLPLSAHTVRGFLSMADDNGRAVLAADDRDLVIENHWMTVVGDWVVMLGEDLTAASS